VVQTENAQVLLSFVLAGLILGEKENRGTFAVPRNYIQ
jgi:hypothetical protein